MIDSELQNRHNKLLVERHKLIKALKIYDECMQELSFYVGHTYGRVTEAAHAHAVKVCKKGMKAQRILDRAVGGPTVKQD